MAKHNKGGDTLRGNYVHGVNGTLLAVTERAPESQRRRQMDTLKLSDSDYRRLMEAQAAREIEDLAGDDAVDELLQLEVVS